MPRRSPQEVEAEIVAAAATVGIELPLTEKELYIHELTEAETTDALQLLTEVMRMLATLDDWLTDDWLGVARLDAEADLTARMEKAKEMAAIELFEGLLRETWRDMAWFAVVKWVVDNPVAAEEKKDRLAATVAAQHAADPKTARHDELWRRAMKELDEGRRTFGPDTTEDREGDEGGEPQEWDDGEGQF